MEADFTTRAFTPEDEPQVLTLLQAAFGSWPRHLAVPDPAEFFRWKHLVSPFGPSVLVVADTGERVVGFGAWMRWRVRTGEQTFEVLRTVDVCVDPAHQGRGIFMALIREAERQFPRQAAFTFANPNLQSRPGALKSGRREGGTFRRSSAWARRSGLACGWPARRCGAMRRGPVPRSALSLPRRR